jgi:DNA polymerase III delta subunit
MSNIFLFTGEDRYVVDQEINRWKEGFLQKFGWDAIFSYSPENFDPTAIIENCLGGGLFVSKKMLIIKHVPADTYGKMSLKIIESFTESYIKQHNNISSDTIVLFVSYKPDKRLKLYKFLEKHAEHKDFKALWEWQRKKTIQQWSGDIIRSDDTLDYFLLQVGTDMYRLQSETDKLLIWAKLHNKQHITKEDIDIVTFWQVQPNTFALFDYLFTKPDKALALIDAMREDGTNRNEALWAMCWWMALFIMMVDGYNNGARDAKSIAQRAGYNPFAISKQMSRIQTLLANTSNIQKIYKGLIDLDVSIKTGKLPAEAFWIRTKDLFYSYGWWKKS